MQFLQFFFKKSASTLGSHGGCLPTHSWSYFLFFLRKLVLFYVMLPSFNLVNYAFVMSGYLPMIRSYMNLYIKLFKPCDSINSIKLNYNFSFYFGLLELNTISILIKYKLT